MRPVLNQQFWVKSCSVHSMDWANDARPSRLLKTAESYTIKTIRFFPRRYWLTKI